MSTSLRVHSVSSTGVLAVAMPMRMPAMSAGSFTGRSGSEAITKGFFCIATPMMRNGAPSATAAAV